MDKPAQDTAEAAAPPKRIQIGVRVAPDVKEMIEAAAAANGRSLAQETELRIVESFELDSLLGDAKTKAFLIELALQIARAEAATGKRWREDGATYWATLKLIEDAVRRAAPTPPNYPEIRKANAEIIRLDAQNRPLVEMLQRCGALGYPNALAVEFGRDRPTLSLRPRECWHMPDEPTDALGEEEAKLIEDWLVEWRSNMDKIIRLGERLQELQEPVDIAKASGAALHKHLTAAPETEPSAADEWTEA